MPEWYSGQSLQPNRQGWYRSDRHANRQSELVSYDYSNLLHIIGTFDAVCLPAMALLRDILIFDRSGHIWKLLIQKRIRRQDGLGRHNGSGGDLSRKIFFLPKP